MKREGIWAKRELENNYPYSVRGSYRVTVRLVYKETTECDPGLKISPAPDIRFYILKKQKQQTPRVF
jgi:hypothetical protein